MGQNKKQALSDLKKLLHSEREWVKVHVAEFLIWEQQCVDEVREVFLKEEQLSGNMPKYRIGIWRVLAQAAEEGKNRQYWVDKIIGAYQAPQGEDRLHAIETLAKLKVPVVGDTADNLLGSMRLYSLWNYATGAKLRQGEVKTRLLAELTSDTLSELEMQVTSYILRYLDLLSDEQFGEIYEWMQDKDLGPSLCGNLLATLWMVFPESGDSAVFHTLKKELIALRSQPEALNHIMMALAVHGRAHDSAIIHDLFEVLRDTTRPDYNSDLHATAAYMVLKVSK